MQTTLERPTDRREETTKGSPHRIPGDGGQPSPFTIEHRPDGVALLRFDLPDEKVNTLRPEQAEPLGVALEQLGGNDSVAAVVLASAKEDSFVVGADVHLLREIETEEEGVELARQAQEMMNRLEAFPKPLVAAIHGDCVGGGLELALACDERVASDADATRLGQPEVQLGLVPGAGGTQRLPRLIGLEEALKMILTGRRAGAGKARRLGLVDETVHPAALLDAASERAIRLAEGGSPSRGAGSDLKELLLESNPLGRRLLYSQSEKKARQKTGGHMPAPFEAIEAIRLGLEESLEAGYRAEAEAFGRLLASPQARALTDLFLWRQELAKETGLEGTGTSAEAREVEKVAVVGAGLMGSGIARVTAENAGLPVRLKDVDHEPLLSGLRSLSQGLDKALAKGRLEKAEHTRILDRLRPTLTYTGFGRAGVVIEAVVEDLEIKKAVLRDAEKHIGDQAVFASNTSSLPIARIAEEAEHPQRVAGMHYFSPVEKVPLLEVVAAEKTAPEVVATCVELGKRQGKTVIVVGDGTGFYTTRILGPYLNEAAHLLDDGAMIEEIDGALTDQGFPVGPLKLLDEVGIDVGAEIAAILHDAFGPRMEPASAQQKVAGDDRKGRKNGRGFYEYREKASGYERTGSADMGVYRLLDAEPQEGTIASSEIVRRCALIMANEAVRCLDEGIVRSVRDAEVGAVFGLGFPPHLGGPLRFLDQRGIEDAVRKLTELTEIHGSRFEPAARLSAMAASGETFHEPRS